MILCLVFFRFTDQQAYLIIIDKRSNCNSELRRCTFYGLLHTYDKEKFVESSSTISFKQMKKSTMKLFLLLIKIQMMMLLVIFMD